MGDEGARAPGRSPRSWLRVANESAFRRYAGSRARARSAGAPARRPDRGGTGGGPFPGRGRRPPRHRVAGPAAGAGRRRRAGAARCRGRRHAAAHDGGTGRRGGRRARPSRPRGGGPLRRGRGGGRARVVADGATWPSARWRSPAPPATPSTPTTSSASAGWPTRPPWPSRTRAWWPTCGASRRERRALAAALVLAQEEERRRVAEDLHDGPVQELTGLEPDAGRAGTGAGHRRARGGRST